MFRRVLVPVDLSTGGARPVRVAADLAASHGSRLTLIHVIQRIDGIPAADLRAFYAKVEATARRRLAALRRRVAGRVRAVRCEVIVGDPAADIVRFAARQRMNLIVIGSHRVEPGRRGHGLGTTSYKTAVLCGCPVLLVK